MSDKTRADETALDTSTLLGKTLSSLISGAAGITASDRKDLILSVAHILQRIRGGSFLSQLKAEWDSYVTKGSVKLDYSATEQHQACLQEMLEFIDRDTPDKVRFTFMKKIFLAAATEKGSTRDSVIPQQFMALGRGLSTGGVLVLQATFDIMRNTEWRENRFNDAKTWLAMVAERSGLTHPELVEIHEMGLIGKLLLTPRIYADKSGVQLGENFRLTELGLALCSFIENYEPPGDV